MTSLSTTSTTAATGTAVAVSPTLGADPTRTSGASSAPTEEAAAVEALDVDAAVEPMDTVRAYRDGDGRVHYASPHSKATRQHVATGGWAEVDTAAPSFDPTGQRVKDVVAYLAANADDPAEIQRVKDVEAAGEKRPTIANWSPADDE